MRKEVVAIACGDIHLSLMPPVARSEEPDWLDAQGRILDQVHRLAWDHKAPILCTGDVFDRWNSPPELINWAMRRVPRMYSIPGQHDLPLHRLDLIHKSAYRTLAVYGELVDVDEGLYDLPPGEMVRIEGSQLTIVQGFPWGVPLTPSGRGVQGLKIAILHQYIWVKGKSYPGAPKDHKLSSLKGLDGWDVVVTGDNHQGFLAKRGTTTIFNCGCLIRRKSDEINYQPQVGIIYEDGSVEPHLLDCSADKIKSTSPAREPEENMGLTDFLKELTKLQGAQLDFKEAMKRALVDQKPSEEVRQLILEAMDE